MNVLWILGLGTLLVNYTAIAAKNDKYSGYSVHGIELRHRSDQKVLYDLRIDLNIDLWEHGAPGTHDAYIMLSPEDRVKVLDVLDTNDIKHYLHLTDVSKALEEHQNDLSHWQQTRKTLMPFQTYPTYTEVDAYMEHIAEQYPDLVTLVNAGNSFEGRAIKYLKISTSNFANQSKPIYFMDATMHAREWVTTPVTLYTIHRLVEDLRDEDRDLLEDVDWIILPIVNPDGYEFTRTDDRLWRGTRSYNPDVSTTCYGVDANRNFDVNFNTLGVSTNPCALNYPGHAPFSEPETRYVRDILLENIDRIQIYMNIHSWGNYVLYGYGNATLPSNKVHVHYVAAAMGAHIDAVKIPQASYYTIGNSNLILYGSSGSAQDYGQAVGVPFSYTLELPGYRYGFLVPPKYIEQINTETWCGIAVTARLSNTYYSARNQSKYWSYSKLCPTIKRKMSAISIVLFVGIAINSVIAANSDIYSGYSVHGVQLRHRSDQKVIFEVQADLNVDLWEHGAPGSRDAFIMLSPKNRVEVLNILDANDMKHYLHVADVAKTLREHEGDLSRWQQRRQNLEPFQTYARYGEIVAYMERIARQYPDIAKLVNIGKSFEGRDIKYLKISTSDFNNSSKPIYFMDATMHAREWVTPPVALYAIHRLVEDLREGDRDLLENVDWIILPVVNPDGYEFSHTDDRLWRGTRSVNETTNQITNTNCIGVDPNRNFDVNFNTLGVSSDPCSQIYPGHEPFSEVETRYVRDILLENIDRIQIYMDIHSWGNYVLYGLDNATLPSNVVDQHLVAAAMGAHIDTAKLPVADFYLVGNSNLMLYGTSGAGSDYAVVSGVPMSYTLELPGYRYSFEVPPQYIEQINTETWRGIAASARLSTIYYSGRVRS
ncbi:uncharacterized protein LOC123870997 [Maniola jurtina]|uniref:uncharacterized protein LOC123870997 n=1 Tax=Maniola jurtina TaxID=191418 RepID=UPI001E68A3EF|nr:uncharacterized protein LOC123870997 [Maniola jurtina]